MAIVTEHEVQASPARHVRGMLFLLLAATILLFLPIWPKLDMALSQHFYLAGQGFYLNQMTWVQWVYRYTPGIGRGIAVTCLLMYLLGRWFPRRIPAPWRRVGLAVFLTAIVGSGVVVDLMLKPWWSRPRPVHVVEFGGQKAYKAPMQPCFLCAREYSFVSGHAAAGFSLMAFGAAGSLKRRRRWLMAGALMGGFIGAVRIMQGGHFLSDVVFSFLAIWLVFKGICWLLDRYPEL